MTVARDGQGRALALGTLAFAVSFMAWGMISPLAPTFQKSLGLTNTQVSLLIAVPVLLGSVGRLPMGLLTDLWGGRRVFGTLLLVQLLPLAGLALSHSYAQLLGWSFCLGLAGTSFAVGVPFVSRWFPAQKQGVALGVYGAGNIGQAGAALLAPRVAAAYGWPAAFGATMIPVAVTLVLFWLLAQDAPARQAPAGLRENLKAVQGDGIAWLLSFFYFLTFGGFVAFSNYLPKLYVDLYDLSKTQAGNNAALFVLLATAMRPVGGWLADRVGGARVLPSVFAVAVAAAATLSFGQGIGAFKALVLILAVAFGLGNGAVFKLVPQFFPGRTGAVTGIVGAMGGLGGFFPPLAMGLLRDRAGSYGGGFALLAVFSAAALVGALWLLARSKPRD